MPDPGTITGVSALAGLIIERIYNYFRGDLKVFMQDFKTAFGNVPSDVTKLQEMMVEVKATTSILKEGFSKHLGESALQNQRQVELLKEIVSLLKDLQKDVMEIKLRARGG